MKFIKPVSFSETAIREAKKMMADQRLGEAYALRVAVGGGGCSGGMAPVLGFDKQKPTDLVYEIDGVKIVVDKSHVMHLIGKHVEFYEVQDLSGFHFVDGPVDPL